MRTPAWSADERESFLVDRFSSYSARVNGFVLSRCGDPTVAADVTAEVFVAAARAIGGDDPDQVTEPWLIATARRRLIDHWRSQRTRRNTLQSLTAQPRVDRAAAPDVDLDRVRRALASLSASQRAALVSRYLDDLSVSEVADTLQLSYQATESLLARARRSFERAWEVS